MTRLTLLPLLIALGCTSSVATDEALVSGASRSDAQSHEALPVEARANYLGRLYDQVDGDNLGPVFAHLEPGLWADVLAELHPNARMVGTGRIAQVGGEEWIEVSGAQVVSAWVRAMRLIEVVDSTTFCDDTTVSHTLASDLLIDLERGLRQRDPGRIFGTISPQHGLRLQTLRGGETVWVDDADAEVLFDSDANFTWGVSPGSGEPVEAPISEAVLPGLHAALNAGDVSCNRLVTGAASYEATLPAGYENLNFFSVHVPGEFEWVTWIVTVAHVEGQPYIYSMHRLGWEA